jgi:hypothetical protein
MKSLANRKRCAHCLCYRTTHGVRGECPGGETIFSLNPADAEARFLARRPAVRAARAAAEARVDAEWLVWYVPPDAQRLQSPEERRDPPAGEDPA